MTPETHALVEEARRWARENMDDEDFADIVGRLLAHIEKLEETLHLADRIAEKSREIKLNLSCPSCGSFSEQHNWWCRPQC